VSTWMVVEDEPDIYDVLLAMFEIWGIEGIAFVDGGEAVAWVDDVDKGTIANELPELAILDIRLPEISGPEVGARIRRSERLGQIAIVLITAYRLSADEEEHVKSVAQADMLMYKPLPPMPELRKTLDQIIAKRRLQKAAMASANTALPPIQAPTINPTTSPPTNPTAPATASTPTPPSTANAPSKTTPPPASAPVRPPTVPIKTEPPKPSEAPRPNTGSRAKPETPSKPDVRPTKPTPPKS